MLDFTISQHHTMSAQQFEEAARQHRMAAQRANEDSLEFANMHAHLAALHQAKAIEHAQHAARQFATLHG